MKKNTEALFPETFYHIYNRGINSSDIFFTESNYQFFITKWIQYIEPIADTYAYCLLKNHFHFCIKMKSENEIRVSLGIEHADRVRHPVSVFNKTEKNISQIISLQFSHLINSYAQANKEIGRAGGLFETPFRRILVDEENYLPQLIYYIHNNPVKHGLTIDIKDYLHSSFHSLISESEIKLKRNEVFELFSGKNEFIAFHNLNSNLD
jgi:putative transposase